MDGARSEEGVVVCGGALLKDLVLLPLASAFIFYVNGYRINRYLL